MIKKYMTMLLMASAFMHLSAQFKTKDLPGVWRLLSLTAAEQSMYAAQLGNPRMEFNNKGGYMINLAGQKESGRYTCKKQGIIRLLPIEPPGKSERILKMSVLRNDSLEYSITEGEITSKSLWIRVAGAWNKKEEREHEAEEREREREKKEREKEAAKP
jgi:hypothetical protein